MRRPIRSFSIFAALILFVGPGSLSQEVPTLRSGETSALIVTRIGRRTEFPVLAGRTWRRVHEVAHPRVAGVRRAVVKIVAVAGELTDVAHTTARAGSSAAAGPSAG